MSPYYTWSQGQISSRSVRNISGWVHDLLSNHRIFFSAFKNNFCGRYWGLNSGLSLVRQALYHLNHNPMSFCIRYFSNRVSNLYLGLPGPQSSYLCFLCSWDDRHMPPHPGFINVVRVLGTFFPGWLRTSILPISTSQIARSTGVSHKVWQGIF
jgi:hypothetical protein